MIEFVVKKLMAWCERTGRVFKITGTAGPDDVYLIRYYVVRSKWFNIFIHQFLRSDRDDLHDHPWNFFTYLVKGSYTERRWNPKTQMTDSVYRINKDLPGFGPVKHHSLVFRRATDQHQVLVDEDLKECQKDEAALTLFVSGPTKREWGFVKIVDSPFLDEQKANKKIREWVPWKKYLGLPDDAPGRG